MSKIKLFLNEDIHLNLAKALRMRGFDVTATQEAELSGTSDEKQLEFAAKEQRVVLTFNRGDYIKLFRDWAKENKTHAGIIVSEQIPIGELLKRILKLLLSLISW